MQEIENRSSINSAVSHELHKFSGYMLMDDLDQVQAGELDEDGLGVVQRMQSCIDNWENW